MQVSGPWDPWLPVVKNSRLFALRRHSAQCAPRGGGGGGGVQQQYPLVFSQLSFHLLAHLLAQVRCITSSVLSSPPVQFPTFVPVLHVWGVVQSRLRWTCFSCLSWLVPPSTLPPPPPCCCQGSLWSLLSIAMPDFKNMSLEHQCENTMPDNAWCFSGLCLQWGAPRVANWSF